MNSKGIGPQGLGSKSHNGFWIGNADSPAKQASKSTDPMARFKKQSNTQKMQESLKKSNETVDKAKANKKPISIDNKISQDWNNQSPVEKAIVQLIDPTGITSYGDVNKAWNDGKTTWDDITEPIGALPLIGKIPKVIGAGFKIAKSLSTVEKIAKSANEINKVTSKVNKASKISNQGKVAQEVVSAAKRVGMGARRASSSNVS